MSNQLPHVLATSMVLAACAQAALAADVPAAPPAADTTSAVKFTGIVINWTGKNFESGAKPDQWGNTTLLQVGADVDMERAVAWRGAKIHVRESLFFPGHNGRFAPPSTGHFWAQDTGSTLGGAPFPNFIPKNHLSVLTLEQQLGKINVEFGRTNPSHYFDIPTCESVYACQNPITLYNRRSSPKDFATWGGRVKYAIDKNQYVQLGAFEDNFSSSMKDGLNWSSAGRTGWTTALEYGYKSTFADQRYPLNVSLGVWHDSSPSTDPVTRVARKGSDGLAARFQRVAWRADDGKGPGVPPKYLTAFATAGYSPTSSEGNRAFVEAGANFHGPFASRPGDHYGVKLAYLRLNDSTVIAEQRKVVTPGFQLSRNQFRAEVNGHIELKRGIFIEPVLQYIKNPNLKFAPGGVQAPKSGFNFGLVTFISLPALF